MDRSRWMWPATGSQQQAVAPGQQQRPRNMYGVPVDHQVAYQDRLARSDEAKYGSQARAAEAKYQSEAASAPARYGAQAQKDSSLFGSMSNLGIAGLNAIGQYGTSRNNALMNQSVAAANAYNQMAAADLNARAQLGQSMAGMAAAAGQAGADTNKATALSGLGQGMVNAGMYGAQMAPYTAGNMPNFNFGGFGGGGFQASGPEGGIASGSYGRGGASGGNRGGRQPLTPPPPPYVGGNGGSMVNPYAPFREGARFLGGLRNDMNSPGSYANRAMSDMTREFGMNRAGVMDNSVLNSLNANIGMGYDALSAANAGSNYGFNTAHNRPSQFSNQIPRWFGR